MLTGHYNTCNSEDCNWVCHICNKNQSETESAIIRHTRSRKQNKIDWMNCNKCGQWVHPQRSGINKKEITKINKCIKANKAEPFFKCLKCSILSTKTFGIDILQFIKQTTESVPCQSQTENHISHPSITTDQSKQVHSSSNQTSVAPADQNTNRLSPQGREISYTENPPESRKKQISDTNSLPADFKNFHSSLNIRLIDKIPQTLRPKNSTQIKKRIKEFSSEQINIQYSYTLRKGGVAIHTETKKNAETLEKEIYNILPDSSCAKPLTQTGFTKVDIKNINPFISTEDIKQFVDKKFNQNSKIRRFRSSVNRKPLPIISISCHSEINSKLLIEGVDIFGNCEQYKKPVIRYFNCQQFVTHLHLEIIQLFFQKEKKIQNETSAV